MTMTNDLLNEHSAYVTTCYKHESNYENLIFKLHIYT